MTDQRTDHEPWPMRAALLLVLGALSGLAFALLIRGESGEYWSITDSVPRLSLATFIATGGVLFAFTLERTRWAWSAAFAVGAGMVLAGIFYWNDIPAAQGPADLWRAFAALLAVAIAAPLFQTMRDEGARRLPYVPVHTHAWANIVIWCAAWAFVLITWLLAQLLAELFQLIGIHLFRDLLAKSWSNWMLVGGTLGGAIGLLRDRDRIVGLIQRVVTTILSVLAPVLAAGLVLFVLALPFTGLGKLWERTSATTPILLTCIFGAFVLANAVIGTAPEEEAKGRVLRWSAMALGATMLPLAAVAAISTWLRIAQYGFTPERLWALVFVAIALASASLYLYALVRRREAWAELLRPANIRLAIGICLVALLLATPLADFGAISTRSQLARLESGRVTPERFDWRAMRFDFGPSGVAALERLRAGGVPEVRRLATAALAAERPDEMASPEELRVPIERYLRVVPAGRPIPEEVRWYAARAHRCGAGKACVVVMGPGPDRASLVSTDANCAECDPEVETYYRGVAGWLGTPSLRRGSATRHARLDAALRAGRVEVREVPRRQIFVDGEPVGEAFE